MSTWIKADRRELAAILAGLRMLERAEGNLDEDIEEIVTDDGQVIPLTTSEIFELCTRINTEEPEVSIGINMEGGCVQQVFTDAEGIAIDMIRVDWDTEGADECDLAPVPYPYSDDEPEEAYVCTEIVERDPAWMSCYRAARDAKNAKNTTTKPEGEKA